MIRYMWAWQNQGQGWRKSPPKSNLERQREFRARNPGYFNKYKRRSRQRVAVPVAVEATQPAPMLALPEPVVSLLPDLLAAVAEREAELVSQSPSVERELPIVF